VTLPVYNIELPLPPIGNKIFCAQEIGMYILERGPCTIRSVINTRIGNGALSFYDAVPDESGHMPANAKVVLTSSPPILGCNMLDGGLHNGLTMVLHASGGANNLSPCTTVTWFPDRKQKRHIDNV